MSAISKHEVRGHEHGLPIALAVLSLAAAAIHLAVVGEHFLEYAPFGVFFAVTAWAQALWAIAVVTRFGRAVLIAGVLGNAVIVVLWGVSRTVGVPIGPEPWHPEAVATIDVVCTIAEGLIVLACVGVLVRFERLSRPALARIVAIAAVDPCRAGDGGGPVPARAAMRHAGRPPVGGLRRNASRDRNGDTDNSGTHISPEGTRSVRTVASKS